MRDRPGTEVHTMAPGRLNGASAEHEMRQRAGLLIRTDVHGRGERSHTAITDLIVPARLPLEIEVTGAERWLRSSTV